MSESAATSTQSAPQAPSTDAPAAAPAFSAPEQGAPKEDKRALAIKIARGEADAKASVAAELGQGDASSPDDGDQGKPPAPPPGREWKALRAREKQIAERERALEGTRSQLEGQVRELGQKAAVVDKLAELAKSDPIGLLEHFGVSIDALTAHYLEGQKPDAVARREAQRVLAEERKAKEEAEAKAKAEAEANAARASAAQRAEAQQEFLYLAGRESVLHGYSHKELLAAASQLANEMLRERPQGFAVKDVVAEMVRRIAPPSMPQEAGDEPQSSKSPMPRGAKPSQKGSVTPITQARAGESSGKQRRLSDDERRALALKIAQGG